MDHDNPKLARLETDRTATAGHGDAVDRGFRKIMMAIRGAVDERDFYRMKSFHFEQLIGREPERSLRINKQWRLIIELRGAAPNKRVGVIKIEDYH